MPYILKYDGTSDPHEHITTYTIPVKRNDLAPHEIKSVLLMKFDETLTKGALTWYFLLPEHLIGSFEMLADSFIKTHAGGHNHDKNQEKFRSDFDADRRSSKNRFQPYERADGRGIKGLQSLEKFVLDRRMDHGRSSWVLQEKEPSGSRDSAYPRSDYNFNISLVELVSVMRKIKEARFPKSIRSDPSQRDPNLWCEFHGTHDHRTGDCRHLLEEVAMLLKNGHLREFLSDRAKNNYGRNRDVKEPTKPVARLPRLTIKIIFGEVEVNRVMFSAANRTKISITHGKRVREAPEDDKITFMEEDVDGLLLQHNDALEGKSTARPPLFNGQYYSWRKNIMRDHIQGEDYELWDIVTNGPLATLKKNA
ncbi:uncharacterized protein LOC142173529 [Nicotiana tabacum]|uniref:Uncharacterized protein LOC142173529 n=1 Tax=Nicotiana tabacum TaxID=4097 RepID=A0AC58TDE6_TOBAC